MRAETFLAQARNGCLIVHRMWSYFGADSCLTDPVQKIFSIFKREEKLLNHFPSKFVCFSEWIVVFIVFPAAVLFCLCVWPSVCLCVCRAWCALCVEVKQSQQKWVTWPSILYSSPQTFLCLYTCVSFYLFHDLCEMYTEAHVSVGCFRRRAGPAGQTVEEIPQAHMELVSLSKGAPELGWVRKGSKFREV